MGQLSSANPRFGPIILIETPNRKKKKKKKKKNQKTTTLRYLRRLFCMSKIAKKCNVRQIVFPHILIITMNQKQLKKHKGSAAKAVSLSLAW
jgi:hypothetical protein